MPCFCGCGERPVVLHHLTYQQHIRRARPANVKAALADQRNLVPVAEKCHARHHSRILPYRLSMLPDSAFEFAAELLGPEKAFNYLGRNYKGADPRLDALLSGVPVEREGTRDAA